MSSKNRGRPQNDRFQSVREQLERETASLLAQRRTLEGASQARPEGRPNVRPFFGESVPLTPVAHREEGDHRTQEVIGKLQEIIRLCKEEGTLTNEEMREVVKVETEVLNYLQRGSEADMKLVKPAQDTPQADREKLPANHTWGKPQTRLQQNPPLSPDDTLQIIAELERKALTEIIHLQRERDALRQERDQLAEELSRGGKLPFNEGDRLREENRLLREENHALQVRLSTVGAGPTVHRPSAGEDFARDPSQYNSQIAVYENELKRATVVINELRGRLEHVGGLEELHEQGERIRRETAELLQYRSRSGQGEDSKVIRELQERLEQQERGKAMFFEELKAFKQRLLKLEEENQQLKRNNLSNASQFAEYSPLAERVSARGEGRKRTGFSDYEKTLNEMRQVVR